MFNFPANRDKRECWLRCGTISTVHKWWGTSRYPYEISHSVLIIDSDCGRGLKYIHLFQAKRPLESAGIDIFGPLTKSSKGNRFILVIFYGFKKLTEPIPLITIDSLATAAAFIDNWVFRYGSLKEVLSDNSLKFGSKFFQGCVRFWVWRTLSQSFTNPRRR